MCSSDYSAPFDYVDRIIIDYAHDLCKGISSHVISLLKTHPKKEILHNHLFSAPIRGRVNPLSKRQA